MTKNLNPLLKRITSKLLQKIFRILKRGAHNTPKRGDIFWGDFEEVVPFSDRYGYDRGGPIDRYYIENFLSSESSSIKGRVLEVADNAYTIKYGAGNVKHSDVLHLDSSVSGVTFVADLGKENNLPSEYFDCIILTQTLQFIYDYPMALKNCYRMLKAGGTLLLTVPGISAIERGKWHKSWLWSFNHSIIEKVFSDLFAAHEFEVKSYGNVYAAISFLHGIALSEVNIDKLNYRDIAYDVIISVKLTKSL